MGTTAGFEEKEYETLANIEFAAACQCKPGQLPQVFSPGQTLEKALGFDFSINLKKNSSTFKKLFGGFTGPVSHGSSIPGINQPSVSLPAGAPAVNVFIQYKRPTYYSKNNRSTLWKNQEYLGFDVRQNNSHQQLETLARLAAHNPTSKVRYACPSAWTKIDLYSQYDNGDLLSRSAFVDPRNLSHAVNGKHSYWHNRWTFPPSRPALGKPNPDGNLFENQSGEEFLRSLLHSASATNEWSFIEQIHELQLFMRELQEEIKIFEGRSRFGKYTKKEAIEFAVRSVSNDLDDAIFVTESDYASRQNSQHNPTNTLSESDVETIRKATEIAATARELQLTWMVSSNL